MRSNGVNRYLESHGFFSDARAYNSGHHTCIDSPYSEGALQLFTSLKQYDVEATDSGLNISLNRDAKKVCQECGFHMTNVEVAEVYTGNINEYNTPELVTPPIKRTVRAYCKACGARVDLNFYTLPPIG